MKDILMIPVDLLSCVFFIPKMIVLSLLMDSGEFKRWQDSKYDDELAELTKNASADARFETYGEFSRDLADFVEL